MALKNSDGKMLRILPVLLRICRARDQGRLSVGKLLPVREQTIFSGLYVLSLAMNTATPVLVRLTCFSQRAPHLFYMVNRK